MSKVVKITTPYITLGQFLKFSNTISNGGMAKAYLSQNPVKVNEALENRRGRKLYPGDIIKINQESYSIGV